ncbi:MAG: ATP-binding protein [Lachnospiraceae bacterium]
MEFLKELLEELSRYNHAGTLRPEVFSLTELLEDICRDAGNAWTSVRTSFQKETAVPMAYADKTKLKEAVLNLIRNSAEALRDSAAGEIRLSLSFENEWFLIKVSNNGPQILPDRLEDIFEPFVSYKRDGTGLGLPIVRADRQRSRRKHHRYLHFGFHLLLSETTRARIPEGNAQGSRLRPRG